MAGWGGKTFSAFNAFFWIPWLVPHIGGLFGAIIYIVMVGGHHKEDEDDVK